MTTVVQDLVFAVRHLRRRRAVTGVAITMLGIGIGTATAMFSVVDGVLLRALPYRDASRLVNVWQTYPHWQGHPVLGAQWDRIALSYDEYTRIAALDHDFESVAAAYWRGGLRLTGAGDPVEVSVARGSASLLSTLGVQPILGRWFLPDEEGTAAPALAVIPYEFWQSRFGGDGHVLGSTVVLEGRPFQIIGVLPATFAFTSISAFATGADRQAVWTPIGSWPGDLEAGSQNYESLVRLRPDVSVPQVREELASAIRADRGAAQHDARLVSRKDGETTAVRSPLLLLFSAVTLLLMITCGNLAALLFGEASLREQEIRTRRAIGASMTRIVRQLLTEHALLAAAGAAAGLPLAAALTRWLVALSPTTVPRAESIAVDWRVAGFSMAAAAAATLLFGAAPAISLARTRLRPRAADSRAVSGQRRAQHVVIAAQIGLSTVLLVAAGLLVRTLAFERAAKPGFDAANLLTVSLNASPHSSRSDRQQVQRFYDDVIERLAALPAVTAVTATSNVPISGTGGQWAVSLDPSKPLGLGSPNVQHDEVLPGFFAVLGIPILTGRPLLDEDRAGRPLVAVVNETMARTFWPQASALGKTFLAPNGGTRTVVGVSADIAEQGLGRTPSPTFYESLRQVSQPRLTILLRTPLDPDSIIPAIRKTIVVADPLLPIELTSSMDEIIHASMAPERYRVLLVGFFAGVAVMITLIGIAGVASRTVSAQMRELCIRMAIGASATRIVRLVVGRYVRMALAGLAAGVAVAAMSMPVVDTYLVGVTSRDPTTYVLVAGFVATLAAFAVWTAAKRLHCVRIAEEIAA